MRFKDFDIILGNALPVWNNSRASRTDRLVGRNIKRRRLDRGISKTEAMRHIGVSSAAYDALEDGYQRPSAAALYKLATLFNCKLSDFFLDELDGIGRVRPPTPS